MPDPELITANHMSIRAATTLLTGFPQGLQETTACRVGRCTGGSLSTYHAMVLAGRKLSSENVPKKMIGPRNLKCQTCAMIADAALSGENMIGKTFPGYFPWRTEQYDPDFRPGWKAYQTIAGIRLIPGLILDPEVPGVTGEVFGYSVRLGRGMKATDHFSEDTKTLKQVVHSFLLMQLIVIQALRPKKRS